MIGRAYSEVERSDQSAPRLRSASSAGTDGDRLRHLPEIAERVDALEHSVAVGGVGRFRSDRAALGVAIGIGGREIIHAETQCDAQPARSALHLVLTLRESERNSDKRVDEQHHSLPLQDCHQHSTVVGGDSPDLSEAEATVEACRSPSRPTPANRPGIYPTPPEHPARSVEDRDPAPPVLLRRQVASVNERLLTIGCFGSSGSRRVVWWGCPGSGCVDSHHS